MNNQFTDKDKMLARKYREAGYKWIVRHETGELMICKDKPIKKIRTIVGIVWLIYDLKQVDKRNFKSVQFSDSEPTKLDDIIGGKK